MLALILRDEPEIAVRPTKVSHLQSSLLPVISHVSHGSMTLSVHSIIVIICCMMKACKETEVVPSSLACGGTAYGLLLLESQGSGDRLMPEHVLHCYFISTQRPS